MKSDVSILIPARGPCEYIVDTLKSIVKSQVQPDEIMIIDDGLTQNALQVIQNFSYHLPINISKNDGVGLVDALNTGLKLISSKYICRIDSDDLMSEMRIGTQLKRLQSDSKLVVVGSQCLYIDEKNEIIGRSNYSNGLLNTLPNFETECLLAHPSTMYLREKALLVGGYRSLFSWNDMDIAEDFDLWLRLSKIGKIEIISEYLTSYRQHKSQLSTKYQAGQLLGTPYIAALNKPGTTELKRVYFLNGFSSEFMSYLKVLATHQGAFKTLKILLLMISNKLKK